MPMAHHTPSLRLFSASGLFFIMLLLFFNMLLSKTGTKARRLLHECTHARMYARKRKAK